VTVEFRQAWIERGADGSTAGGRCLIEPCSTFGSLVLWVNGPLGVRLTVANVAGLSVLIDESSAGSAAATVANPPRPFRIQRNDATTPERVVLPRPFSSVRHRCVVAFQN
jgi:hypothetical protein